MSKETKSVEEDEFRPNTSNLWEKNAEDHQRLDLRIGSLEVKLDRLHEDLTKYNEELKAMRTQMEDDREKASAETKADREKIWAQMEVNREKTSAEMKADREKRQKEDEKLRVEFNANIDKMVKALEERGEKSDTRFRESMREMKLDFKREIDKVEEKAEKQRKEDQIRARWFFSFLVLLAAALVSGINALVDIYIR